MSSLRASSNCFGDAAAQIMQPPVELTHLLLVIRSLQRSCGDRAVENRSAFEDVGNLLLQDLSRTHRPKQRPDSKRDDGSFDRINHAQPRPLPGLCVPSQDENDGRSEPAAVNAGCSAAR